MTAPSAYDIELTGSLYEIMNPPAKLKNALVSRLKIMSNLNIAERRLPKMVG